MPGSNVLNFPATGVAQSQSECQHDALQTSASSDLLHLPSHRPNFLKVPLPDNTATPLTKGLLVKKPRQACITTVSGITVFVVNTSERNFARTRLRFLRPWNPRSLRANIIEPMRTKSKLDAGTPRWLVPLVSHDTVEHHCKGKGAQDTGKAAATCMNCMSVFEPRALAHLCSWPGSSEGKEAVAHVGC